jgi:DNA-directed RNA polymerase subunit RPC12/RpoP
MGAAKKSGLGDIFANATASVGQYPWQGRPMPKQVLICATCGAPQEKERRFECNYCGGDLFVEKRGGDER